MKRLMHLVVVLASVASVGADANDGQPKRKIPVIVRSDVNPAVVKAEEPIPLTVTISNGLDFPISFPSYSLEPTDWNGETATISLVDCCRDAKPGNLTWTDRP